MMTTNTAGLLVTYPYEASSPGVARFQCEDCGGWERSDKNGGQIRHGKRCASNVQPVVVAAGTETLETFAAAVRATATTKGRDSEVLEAVLRGYLSVSDAMNTDD